MNDGPHKGRVYANPEIEAIDAYISAGMYPYGRMRIERLRGQLNELEKKIEEGEKQQANTKIISSSEGS